MLQIAKTNLKTQRGTFFFAKLCMSDLVERGKDLQILGFHKELLKY